MGNDTIRVRFAPSPTGYLHIGSARTALFNWLFARRHGGTFVLRIEDTDEKRNTEAAVAAIFQGLHWLGIEPDEGPEQGGPHAPYFQSQRVEIYQRAVEELKRSAGIYPCFCTKERLEALRKERRAAADGAWQYDGRCKEVSPDEARDRIARGEEHTWRLNVTHPGSTTFDDLILGPTTVDHTDIEDIILIRPDGTPTYNLAVVIDDHEMEVTHVIRGQDHLTNTFKQLLIYRALGWEVPRMGHISLILAPPPHTGKLSKRHGGAELKEYQERGYDPEAVVNWLALIGWSFGGDEETLSREKLVANFDIANAGKANARMNLPKLDAMSGHRIRQMPLDALARALEPVLVKRDLLRPDDPERARKLALMAEMARERIACLSQAENVLGWIAPDYALEDEAVKALRKTEGAPEFMRSYAQALPAPLPEPGALEQAARAFVAEKGLKFGTFAKAVRAAITGRMATPPLFHCIAVLGREEAARRIERGAQIAGSQDAPVAEG